jgi:hypothetical protein
MMKLITNLTVLATLLVLGVSAVGETQYTRARYDLIVERSPFGEDAVDADKLAQQQEMADQQAAIKAAQALAKELRLCFLLESDAGEVKAGFQNLKAKPGDPRNIMLMVGDNYRGMKLKSIDLENATAELDHGGKPILFELTKAPVAVQAAPKTPAQPQRRFGGGFRREQPQEPKQEQPKLSPEEQARQREETRENLRQYQMEVIRAGMPPLPIPLTKEMDDQLVAEGILPPAAAQ